MRIRQGIVLAIVAGVALTGCRGFNSDKTPIHLNPNLDWQAKYTAQSLSAEVPKGTVAWGQGAIYAENTTRADQLQSNNRIYRGREANGNWVQRVPTRVTKKTVNRGREVYDIYCSVCHDRAGTGRGLVIQRGYLPPATDLTTDFMASYEDGRLFDIISNGVDRSGDQTMPGYAKQISADDRWAIVTYIRALQTAKKAPASKLPAAVRSSLK